MREIKFRAWVDNRFVYSGGKEEWLEMNQFGEWEYNTINNSGNGWVVEKVQQYTGIKDKNDKEIYEGDIVKILHGGWMSQHLGDEKQKAMTLEQYLDSLTKQYEVVFATDRFMGKRHIGYNPWETDQEGYTYTRLTPDKHGYVEIIGNIYENPDLLPTKIQK